MNWKGIRVGCAMTGSFCTFSRAFEEYRKLKAEGASLLPVMSRNAWGTDTRFYRAEEARAIFREIAEREALHTIEEVEPIGPKKLVDLMVVMPCTGNTMAKIALGITDTPAAMAVKSALRVGTPVLLAPATNDGLGISAKNIGLLLSTKNIFFVPFGQDDPEKKPQSLVARFDLFLNAAEKALEGKQLQPVLAEKMER